MSMTKNGISTTRTPGTEKYERYRNPVARRKRSASPYLYQYDYRDTDGELFSCVAASLEQCRARRDAWLLEKEDGQPLRK